MSTAKNVPFLDLKRLHASIRDELDLAVRTAIENTAFVGGPTVAQFEEAFGEAHQTGAGAGCGSGTDALSLALRSLGVGPGDEVIVPAMTFIATAEAVVHVGATPVVADVDPSTLLLTPDTVAAVKTSATRAVLPVHLYGHIVPAEHLIAWRNDGLIVIEDAAQAHLGTTDGMPVGTIGHAACFSFYPGKNLGGFGDGGMVISQNPDLVSEVRRIRDHGRTTKYTHEIVGYCSRLDGLQAAVLATKLRHLPRWTDGRRAVAETYRAALGEQLVPWEDGAVHHLLVARVAEREQLQSDLKDAGISSGIHYPVPLSKQPWLAESTPSCPGAEVAAEEILSLPMDPLMTTEEVDYVVDQLVALSSTAQRAA